MSNKVGKEFISSILHEGSVDSFLKLGKCDYLFEHAQGEGKLFDVLTEHLKKYGQLPDPQTFEEVTSVNLPEAPEPSAYYRDRLHERHVHRSLVKASDDASEMLNQKQPLAALDKINETVKQLELQILTPQLFDFRQSHDMVMKSISSKIAPEDIEGLELGWPTFDEMSGGIAGGDLVSFVGRPAQGKTFKLLYSALHGWNVQNKPILFVSMEMSPIKIFERLSAMYTHTPMNWVKTGQFSSLVKDHKKDFSQALLALECKSSPFWVVDGNLTATIDDIKLLCSQLNPQAVFVDGAYLIHSSAYSKHEKIAQVTEGLKKDIATTGGIPVVASYQFNRESMKLKKDETPGLEHIAGSDAIGQLSSLVLGLFQEDTVETIDHRVVDILKGREGETGKFMTHWDFVNMDFTEKKDHDEIEII